MKCKCIEEKQEAAKKQGMVNPRIQSCITWGRGENAPCEQRTYSNITHEVTIAYGRGKGNVKEVVTKIWHDYCPFCGVKISDEVDGMDGNGQNVQDGQEKAAEDGSNEQQ